MNDSKGLISLSTSSFFFFSLPFTNLAAQYILIIFLGRRCCQTLWRPQQKTNNKDEHATKKNKALLWTSILDPCPFRAALYNDATGLSAPKRMCRPLLLNKWSIIRYIILLYHWQPCMQKKIHVHNFFLYVNWIVEPKTWVSSFSYQGIILFQIFGFSLLLLAHLAHLAVHPHGQLSFSQTEDDDYAH